MTNKIIEQLEADLALLKTQNFTKQFINGYDACIDDIKIIHKQFLEAIDTRIENHKNNG